MPSLVDVVAMAHEEMWHGLCERINARAKDIEKAIEETDNPVSKSMCDACMKENRLVAAMMLSLERIAIDVVCDGLKGVRDAKSK